PGYKRG
ncbi:DAHP synthetase I family protein, partial [Chlamydia psittaci 84-8471/1]